MKGPLKADLAAADRVMKRAVKRALQSFAERQSPVAAFDDAERILLVAVTVAEMLTTEAAA